MTRTQGEHRAGRATQGGRKHGVRMPRTATVVALCTALLVVLVMIAPEWLRVPAALLWVLTVPGLPWGLLMRLRDPLDTVVVVVASSMAWTAIVAGGMAVLDLWFPLLAVAVLGLQALAATLLPTTVLGDSTRPRRRQRRAMARRY